MSSILWSPTEQSRTRSYLGQFAADVSGRRDIDVTEWDALHQWSVENPADFWNDVWDFCGVIGDKGHVIYEKDFDAALWPFFYRQPDQLCRKYVAPCKHADDRDHFTS